MANQTLDYDIIYLGGRLAANTHARYLKRESPHLKILILEKKTELSWSPGESTVGVAGLFFIRDLGLSTYLYQNHLPKNGLRFFFGMEEADRIEQCSEIGSNALPLIPTFQIDRKKFDQDLWALNQEIGIDIITGVDIVDIKLGEKKDHQVKAIIQGKNETFHCQWLINSVGRQHSFPLFNQLSPVEVNKAHNTAAVWGRFSGVKDIDLIGTKAWNRQVGYTSRYLSTNHFMYEGAWVWFIPIGDDIVSIGVVYDKDVFKYKLNNQEEFLSFLEKQNILKQLISDGTLLDFQQGENLCHKRKTFCSSKGWAIIGDAYGFVDPLYSPGSDVMARQAHLFNLVLKSNDNELEDNVTLVNKFCDYDYDLVKYLYLDQYKTLGSYEVFNIKSLWDFYIYTVVTVGDFLAEKYQDTKWLTEQINNQSVTIGILKNVQKAFSDLAIYLKENNSYERHNHNLYSLRQNRFKIEEDMLFNDLDKGVTALEFLLVSKQVVAEILTIRFNLKYFTQKKFFYDHLDWHELCHFQLKESWLEKFIQKIATNLKVELTIDNIDQEQYQNIPQPLMAKLNKKYYQSKEI